MINSTVCSSPPIATRIYRDSSSWQIMNYVTSEPGEWSIPLIIQDMGGGSKAKRIYQMAFDRLISKGFVKNGKKTRRGYKILPTDLGYEAFKHTQNSVPRRKSRVDRSASA